MSDTLPQQPRARKSPQWVTATGNILRFLFRQPPSAFGLVVLALLVLSAVLAPVLATHDPYVQDLTRTLLPPSGAFLRDGRVGP